VDAALASVVTAAATGAATATGAALAGAAVEAAFFATFLGASTDAALTGAGAGVASEAGAFLATFLGVESTVVLAFIVLETEVFMEDIFTQLMPTKTGRRRPIFLSCVRFFVQFDFKTEVAEIFF